MGLMFEPVRERSVTASPTVTNPSCVAIQSPSLVDLARFREGMEPMPDLMLKIGNLIARARDAACGRWYALCEMNTGTVNRVEFFGHTLSGIHAWGR